MTDQQATKTRTVRYKINPYRAQMSSFRVTTFTPDDYTLNLICSLTPRAGRVLYILAARIDSTTGLSTCKREDIQRLYPAVKANFSRACREIIDMGLAVKGPRLHTFYLNPKAFKPVDVLFN